MNKDQKEDEEDESVSFAPPDNLCVRHQPSFNDSEITFDRSHQCDWDVSSGSGESSKSSKDEFEDYRRQTERIRTREPYNSPSRNRTSVQAQANIPIVSHPMAAAHQIMNQTASHFRKNKGVNMHDPSFSNQRPIEHDRGPLVRSIRRSKSSESKHEVISKTPGGSLDLDDFQLLASGGIPEDDRDVRRSRRRSKSIDGDVLEFSPHAARDVRRTLRRSKRTDGSAIEQTPEIAREDRRGVRRSSSTDGSAIEPNSHERSERRRETVDQDKLDFQALAGGGTRTRRDTRRRSDQF